MSLVLFSGSALKMRSDIVSKIKMAQTNISGSTISDNFPSVSSDSAVLNPSPLDSPSPSDNSVLGVSTDSTSSYSVGGGNITSVPTPLPSFIPSPLPSYAPQSAPTTATNTSSPPSCSGTPNADNSQVYVTPSSTAVNNAVNIRVELRDCNNTLVSNDNLTMSLISGDSSTTINGSSAGFSYNAQAQNGLYSFAVNSQKPGTNTFKIQDKDHNFEVTIPGYHPPAVTFTITGSGNSSCTADGDAEWSNAYFPSNAVNVGSNVTITIDLRDCNKQATLQSDTITITPNSVDSTFQFVGYGSGAFSLPQGQSSFQVTSQNPGLKTFTIRDTTNRFDVTGPHYSSPSVTFSGSSTPPSPSPSASDTPTPTPSSSPSPSPSVSPTPTDSSTPSPSDTASPSTSL